MLRSRMLSKNPVVWNLKLSTDILMCFNIKNYRFPGSTHCKGLKTVTSSVKMNMLINQAQNPDCGLSILFPPKKNQSFLGRERF